MLSPDGESTFVLPKSSPGRQPLCGIHVFQDLTPDLDSCVNTQSWSGTNYWPCRTRRSTNRIRCARSARRATKAGHSGERRRSARARRCIKRRRLSGISNVTCTLHIRLVWKPCKEFEGSQTKQLSGCESFVLSGLVGTSTSFTSFVHRYWEEQMHDAALTLMPVVVPPSSPRSALHKIESVGSSAYFRWGLPRSGRRRGWAGAPCASFKRCSAVWPGASLVPVWCQSRREWPRITVDVLGQSNQENQRLSESTRSSKVQGNPSDEDS